MMVAVGMPGIGGSLGQCQVCGEIFMLELVTGSKMTVGRINGMDQDIAVHNKCAKKLSGPWEDLPEGPIKEFYKNHFANEPEQP